MSNIVQTSVPPEVNRMSKSLLVPSILATLALELLTTLFASLPSSDEELGLAHACVSASVMLLTTSWATGVVALSDRKKAHKKAIKYYANYKVFIRITIKINSTFFTIFHCYNIFFQKLTDYVF